MESTRRRFYKVVATKMDIMETEILEEANRSDVGEALQFIEENPQHNAIWTIMPMVFE